MSRRVRKIETMRARHTTTSAAATVSTRKTNICPSTESRKREKATNERLTAFNISSMDIKIIKGLRRISTPVTPTVKIMALTMRYHDTGIDIRFLHVILFCPAPSHPKEPRQSVGWSPRKEKRSHGKAPGQRPGYRPVS